MSAVESKGDLAQRLALGLPRPRVLAKVMPAHQRARDQGQPHPIFDAWGNRCLRQERERDRRRKQRAEAVEILHEQEGAAS